MDAFLRGLLGDIERRCGVLRDRLVAIAPDPDVDAHLRVGYREAETLRREAAALLNDPDLGEPLLAPNHLRLAQELERGAKLVEHFLLPFVERYGERDRRLTRLCRHLLSQVRWPLPPPIVLAFSSQYYWTVPEFNVISAPATEEASLLRLPDLVHELGHILGTHHETTLVGDFRREIDAYIAEERRRARRGQRPPGYLPIYDPLEAQWRDEWLVEFVADMVATCLVGPAYGWQHLRLCAGGGSAVYVPGLGQIAAHPSDEARLRGILAVLAALGSAAAIALKDAWDLYLTASGEARPADYEVCYRQALLDSLARRVVAGCRVIGLRDHARPGDPSAPVPHLPALLAEAWERFRADSAGYASWERLRLAQLWRDLGLPPP